MSNCIDEHNLAFPTYSDSGSTTLEDYMLKNPETTRAIARETGHNLGIYNCQYLFLDHNNSLEYNSDEFGISGTKPGCGKFFDLYHDAPILDFMTNQPSNKKMKLVEMKENNKEYQAVQCEIRNPGALLEHSTNMNTWFSSRAKEDDCKYRCSDPGGVKRREDEGHGGTCGRYEFSSTEDNGSCKIYAPDTFSTVNCCEPDPLTTSKNVQFGLAIDEADEKLRCIPDFGDVPDYKANNAFVCLKKEEGNKLTQHNDCFNEAKMSSASECRSCPAADTPGYFIQGQDSYSDNFNVQRTIYYPTKTLEGNKDECHADWSHNNTRNQVPLNEDNASFAQEFWSELHGTKFRTVGSAGVLWPNRCGSCGTRNANVAKGETDENYNFWTENMENKSKRCVAIDDSICEALLPEDEDTCKNYSGNDESNLNKCYMNTKCHVIQNKFQRKCFVPSFSYMSRSISNQTVTQIFKNYF